MPLPTGSVQDLSICDSQQVNFLHSLLIAYTRSFRRSANSDSSLGLNHQEGVQDQAKLARMHSTCDTLQSAIQQAPTNRPSHADKKSTYEVVHTGDLARSVL